MPATPTVQRPEKEGAELEASLGRLHSETPPLTKAQIARSLMVSLGRFYAQAKASLKPRLSLSVPFVLFAPLP